MNMKQIIPFKKELPFKTKVSEITSISLERELHIEEEGMITGVFHITGDYKMNEGSINREAFTFDLPFDITLDPRYDMKTVTSDIEDFYYEVVNEDTLKVSIDLYVSADYLEEQEEMEEKEDKEEVEDRVGEEKREEKSALEKSAIEELARSEDEESTEDKEDDRAKEPLEEERDEKFEVFENTLELEELPSLKEQLEEPLPEDKTSEESSPLPLTKTADEDKRDTVTNIAPDLFSGLDDTETYSTYYVYIVKEDDTIDKILTKYKVTKEDLESYNDLSEIKPGDKIIVPKTGE